MKFHYAFIAGAVFASISLVGPASAQVKERALKVGIGLDEDHPQGQAVKHFATAKEMFAELEKVRGKN